MNTCNSAPWTQTHRVCGRRQRGARGGAWLPGHPVGTEVPTVPGASRAGRAPSGHGHPRFFLLSLEKEKRGAFARDSLEPKDPKVNLALRSASAENGKFTARPAVMVQRRNVVTDRPKSGQGEIPFVITKGDTEKCEARPRAEYGT
jgi:hypothetical protein